MKRIIGTLTIVMLIITSMPLAGVFKLEAASYYPMGCPVNQFEVSYINDDGSFSMISCHDSFSEAKSAMKTNEDYVVRYSKSYSPSKIVAMNSGLAYTYPGRRNSSTMYLIQNPSDRNSSLYKNTYVANHYEMHYIKTCGTSTYDIAPAGKGYIRVDMNGFEGYTDLEYTDLVPSKFLDNNIPIWLGGNNSYENEGPFQVKVHRNYYQIEKNGNYYDLVYHYYRAYPKSGVNGNDALSYSLNVDNAQNYLDAGMKTNTRYYSSDGINFYSDVNLTRYVATVYNYYQFLPLRSLTDISASTFDKFLKSVKGTSSVMYNQASAFISAQNKYGCNALLVYAMACLESAYGTSGYATNRNNLFGWSAYDDSPNDASYFSSIQSCVNEQMGRNLNWFMDYNNRRYFGSCVGNKGAGFNVQYASDPYWGMKIAAIAYSIDKYANNSNGKLTDHNKYTLGFVKDNYNDVLYSSNIEWDSKIYKSATGNSVLYTGRYGAHYQKDLTVIVLEQDFRNNRYKIQSTNPVINGVINSDDGLIPYDFKKSIGYIDTDDVTLLYGKQFEPGADDENIDHEAITIVDDMKLEDNVFTISGVGLITCFDMTDNDKTSHKINIYDLSSDTAVASFLCENTDSSWYSINDGYSYQYAGFIGSYDISSLHNGTYIFKLETEYDDHRFETLLKTPIRELHQFVVQKDDQIIRLSTNDTYGYRIELDIMDDSLDYSQINKTSNRNSLATIDSISYDDDRMIIEGVGMIYYLNYGTDLNYHQLYLVNDEQTVELDTVSHACAIDFQSFYDSSYNMDRICYTATADLDELEGTYKIILSINNGEYLDLVEINNRFNEEYLKLDNDHYRTDFITDRIRYRLMINIENLKGE